MMDASRPSLLRPAARCALLQTLPILTGFGFLGMTYGLYMRVSGFSFLYPTLMALLIYGGSLEFVAVEMLLSPFAPVQVFLTALMLQARHLFYGISMLDRYKGLGKKRFYMIFAMCDETFSVNYSAQIPPSVDRGWFMFFVSLFDQLYWVCAAALGGLLGGLVTFDTQGLEFVMTAMFVVIFLDQWRKEKGHAASLFGVGVSLVCLLLFGPDSFLVPTMACVICLLTLFRRPLEKAGDAP